MRIYLCGRPHSVSMFGGACLISIAICVSGCAQTGDGKTVTLYDDVKVLRMDAAGLDAVERRQLERVQRYARMRVQGAATGGVLGGVAGAVGGLLLAGDGNQAAGAGIGAGAGIVAGAAAGYLAGAYVANLNSAAETRRDDLETQLAAARAATRENEQAVADNRRIVQAERERIARLNQQRRAGALTQEQYRDELGAVRTRVTIVEESLRAAENDAEAVRQTIAARQQAGQSVGSLPAERRKLEAEVVQLRRDRDLLIEAVATIPPDDRDALDVELAS